MHTLPLLNLRPSAASGFLCSFPAFWSNLLTQRSRVNQHLRSPKPTSQPCSTFILPFNLQGLTPTGNMRAVTTGPWKASL